MAGFDPKAYGIDSRADLGLFLFVGGVAGIVDATFNFAQSDPLTIGAMFGAAAVGLKKLLLGSSPSRSAVDSNESPGRDPD